MLRIHGHHDRGALVGEGCVHVGARALASPFAARARRQVPLGRRSVCPRLARCMKLSEEPFSQAGRSGVVRLKPSQEEWGGFASRTYRVTVR